MKSLNDLKVGCKAKIVDVKAAENIRRRLLDIGFVKDALVEKILISPGKDMVAYYIKGAVIAIRKSDTEKIMVEEA